MATDAQASVDCNLPFLQAYAASENKGNPTATALKTNQAAFQKFLSIQPLLAAGQSEIVRLHSQMNENFQICGDKPSANCMEPIRTSFDKQIAQVSAAMNTITAEVPMGNDVDVRSALQQLASGASRDFNAFNKAFSPAVLKLKRSMESFQAELKSGKQSVSKDGSYFYNFDKMPSVREQLLMSDQYEQRLKALGASEGTQHRLLCRRDAEFVRGPARFRDGMIALSVMSMGVAAGVAAAAEGAEISAASLASARNAAAALRVGVTASDMVYAGELAFSCTATPTVVPGAGGKCSVDQGFDGVIAKAKTSDCIVAAAVATLAALPGLSATTKKLAESFRSYSRALRVETDAASVSSQPLANIEPQALARISDSEGVAASGRVAETQRRIEKAVGVPSDPVKVGQIRKMDRVLAEELNDSIKTLPPDKQERLLQLLEDAKTAQGFDKNNKEMPFLESSAGGAVSYSTKENPFLMIQATSRKGPMARIALRHEFSHLSRMDAGDVSAKAAWTHVTKNVLGRRLGLYREELTAFGDQYEYTRKLYTAADLPALRTMYPSVDQAVVDRLKASGALKIEGKNATFNLDVGDKEKTLEDFVSYIRGEDNDSFINFVDKAVKKPKAQFIKESVGSDHYRAQQLTFTRNGKIDQVVTYSQYGIPTVTLGAYTAKKAFSSDK